MQKTRYGGAWFLAFKPAVVLLGLALALAACYPGEPTEISEFDTVATLFDVDADWGSFQTYAMPDTVIHLVAEDQDELPVSRDFDQEILALVRQRIESYGYAEPLDPVATPPDVIFLVSVTASENWVGWVSPCWWCYWGWWPGWGYYPPGWGPGWGWYYPPSGGVARFKTATLYVDMVDPTSPFEVAQDSVIPIYWTAAMNGVLGGSATGTESRLNTSINQAFDQSTYLQVIGPAQ
ncbi:MAG: DUF4136 domain-containing protein [Gemmatimonadota bacterium]|nr:MAG: DUF4136 domain-containing protein [Gemmatimonadota bacterium]